MGFYNQELMGISEIMVGGPKTFPQVSDLCKPQVSCVIQGTRTNHG